MIRRRPTQRLFAALARPHNDESQLVLITTPDDAVPPEVVERELHDILALCQAKHPAQESGHA